MKMKKIDGVEILVFDKIDLNAITKNKVTT